MLQCCGQNYGSSVSQCIVSEAVVRYRHTTTNKFYFSVAMAMIAPHQQAVTFSLHKAIVTVVAIATEHGFATLLVYRNLTFLLLLLTLHPKMQLKDPRNINNINNIIT